MIQSILVSLCEACVLLKLYTFTNPVQFLIFFLRDRPPFYSPTWLLPANTSWRFFQDVVITTLILDSLYNVLKLQCNTMTVKGYAMVTLNIDLCHYQ